MASAGAGNGYAQAYPEFVPDARQRGRLSVAHVLQPGKAGGQKGAGKSNTVPADLIFSTILSKSLLTLALHLVKEWLFNGGAQVAPVNFKLLLVAALVLAVWHRPWLCFRQQLNTAYLLVYSAMIAAETYAFLFATSRLPVLRVIMLTQSSELWSHGLQSMQKKSGATARNANFVALVTLGVCYVAELYLSRTLSKTYINSGYVAILAYIFISATRLHMTTSISADVREVTSSRLRALGVATSLPFAGIMAIVFTTSSSKSLSTSLSASVSLPTIGLLALALHLVDPLLQSSAAIRAPALRYYKWSTIIALATSTFIGVTAFERTLHVADFAVGGVSYWGFSHILYSDPRLLASLGGSSSVAVAASKREKRTALDTVEIQMRNVRSTIKSILSNPDSRKIYYFLCLNLAYMFIQMMYGIWTNSLGLISDSIHMFFDCLALAMGLLASVMATWPRNETFTYGYSRVETLSGFANGIFLVLISIFIVFEAVQRLLDPPEMNTNQLLFVSMIGLAVNLVGMFATGHHHHGHSHGHDHDHHGHGHSHNMHGVFLHVMADTLGSVGVIISTLLINRYGWTGFDPIASIFIAVLIFASVVPLIMDSASLLCLDLGEGRERDVRTALAKLSNIEGLSSYAAARFWPKDPSTVVGSIHIQLAPAPSHDHARPTAPSQHPHSHTTFHANAEKVVQRVESVLKSSIAGLVDLTIQVEPSEGSEACDCMVVI